MNASSFQGVNWTNVALIGGGVAVALYFVNTAGTEVGSGIGTGAELAGGGIGAAAIVGVLLLLL